MKPTTLLSEEHQNILKVVEMLEMECNSLREKSIDRDFFEKVIDFIRNYADKFHHAKEEDILFKEFCKSENLHCNPVEQMLYEHDLGRNFVRGMEEGLNKSDRGELAKNARGYISLIREHIFKEDNILYPMADEVLGKAVQESMAKRFSQIGSEKKRKFEIRGFRI